jgi:hypothetical protein
MNKTFLLGIAILIFLLPLGAGAAGLPANFTSFQCGIYSFVYPGDTQSQVSRKCGPPDAEFSYSDYDRNAEKFRMSIDGPTMAALQTASSTFFFKTAN